MILTSANVTFVGLEEAEMLLIPDLDSDAMVVEVVRVAYRSFGTKSFPPVMSTVTCGVRRAAGYSRCGFVFHGFRVRSGGQKSTWTPHLQVTYSVPRKQHL